MITTTVNIESIRQIVDAAHNMQEGGKHKEAKSILVELARDILKELGNDPQ